MGVKALVLHVACDKLARTRLADGTSASTIRRKPKTVVVIALTFNIGVDFQKGLARRLLSSPSQKRATEMDLLFNRPLNQKLLTQNYN